MEKYIEWDLKNNPDFFKKTQTGRYVDTGVLRHVVANVNCPEGLSDADFFLALNAVAEEVDCIPLADVAPVVHGKWVNFYGDFSVAECSECESQFEVTFGDESNGALWDGFRQFYNYCPACGAKMDGKGEDDGQKD